MRRGAGWAAMVSGVGLLACAGVNTTENDPGPRDGAGAGGDGAVPAAPARPPVALSEIMYNPVLENAAEDNHEFVEILNTTAAAIPLAGWQLLSKGGLGYRFPAGTSIAAGQYLVVAKNRAMLAAVKPYALDPASVLGDYGGELDNGGDTVTLLDDHAAVVDQVQYDDEMPWPIAADALGASESWLPAALLPLATHQYSGVSLERVAYDVPATEVASWAPSAVDGATPGRRNGSEGKLLAVATSVSALPEGGTGLIRNDSSVVVETTLSGIGERGKNPQIELFVDDIESSGETHTTMALSAPAGGASWRAVLPPQPDNSIVRFRILVDRGAGPEPLSPRPSDPFGWHAYFVTPPQKSQARTHQLFISAADWTQMWTNIDKGVFLNGVEGCALKTRWDDRVPAVLVVDGVVYDVRTRYQGSQYQRGIGLDIKSWPYRGPTAPVPLKALSWRIDFPSYRQLDGRKSMNLNKLGDQNCPGVNSVVESRLLWEAGIPTTEYMGFVRLHINGGYYHYMMDLNAIGEATAARVEGKGKPIGDLFKSDGYGGPAIWGPGNASLIPPSPMCKLSALKRYVGTYVRQSLDWKGDAGHDILIKLLTDLDTARKAGAAALLAYFEQNFDIEKLLTQYTIRNWSGVWDDGDHNWFPYKRPSDGKWYVWPQDFDLDYGGRVMREKQPVTVTFYIGEEGVPDVPIRNPLNYLKSAFIQTYRQRFNARLVELSKTLLDPDRVNAVFDEVLKTVSLDDWRESPATPACDPVVAVTRMQDWVRQRHAQLLQGIK